MTRFVSLNMNLATSFIRNHFRNEWFDVTDANKLFQIITGPDVHQVRYCVDQHNVYIEVLAWNNWGILYVECYISPVRTWNEAGKMEFEVKPNWKKEGF